MKEKARNFKRSKGSYKAKWKGFHILSDKGLRNATEKSEVEGDLTGVAARDTREWQGTVGSGMGFSRVV